MLAATLTFLMQDANIFFSGVFGSVTDVVTEEEAGEAGEEIHCLSAN